MTLGLRGVSGVGLRVIRRFRVRVQGISFRVRVQGFRIAGLCGLGFWGLGRLGSRVT